MNSSFSKENTFLQIAWDATSLDLFKTCPRKYQLSILCGQSTNEESVHLTFGILYHNAQNYFDRLLATGVSREKALIQTVRILLNETWNFKTNRPWNSDHPNKNRFTLIRSFVWHTFQYENDQAKTLILEDGRPATELSFHYQTSKEAFTGEKYIICGHLDKLVKLNGQTFDLDYKTTKYEVRGEDFFSYYSPDNQMSLYSFAGKVIYNTQLQGIIIDAAQIMVTFTRFRRGFAQRTPAQIDEWYKEAVDYWIPLAEYNARNSYWPMNDTACGRYGGCQFRGICGKDPKVRQEWLAAGFKTRVWDPLKVRGDI